MKSIDAIRLGVALALALPATGVRAEESKAPGTTLEEVVVTARFREEALQDVGASIAALSDRQLRDRGIDTVADLAALTPSLNLQDRGPNRNEISIRGIGRSLFQQDLSLSMANIGLYFDDVPLNLPVGVQLDVPSFDLNRVEVLRGPQGTLFGEGAQGGALRYFSKDPDLARFGGAAEVSGNSTTDGDTGFGGRVALNLPLSEDKLGLRLVANRTDLGGYIDAPADARKDTNGFHATNVRGVLLWQPNEAFRARVVAAYQDAHQDTLNYVSDPESASFAVFSTADNFIDDTYQLFSANLRYDFGPVAVESITSYFKRDRQRRIFEPVFTGQMGLLGAALGAPTVMDVDNLDRTAYDQWSQEFRFVSNLDGPFNFVAGAFFRNFDLRLDSDTESQKYVELAPTYAFLLGQPPLANPSPRASVLADQLGLTTMFNAPGAGYVLNKGRQLSGFFELTYNFNDKLRAIAGLRRHHETIDATSIAGAADFLTFVPPTDFQDSTTADKWLPKAALEFRPMDHMLIYGSYTAGVRNGNLNASSSVAAVASGDPTHAEEIQVFGPETVKAFELGIKGSAPDQRLTYALAAFHNRIEDVQAYGTAVIMNQVAGVVENIGDGHSAGFEGELSWQATDQLGLFAGGNYIEAEIDSIKTGLVSVITTVPGQRIPFIPKYTFSAGLNARTPVGAAGWEVFGTATYQYIGDYTTFSQGVEGSGQNPILGKYGTANLAIGVRNQRWSVELRASNLFDEREIMSVSPIQDLFLLYGLQLPAGANIDDWQMTRPRTLTLTLRADF